MTDPLPPAGGPPTPPPGNDEEEEKRIKEEAAKAFKIEMASHYESLRKKSEEQRVRDEDARRTQEKERQAREATRQEDDTKRRIEDAATLDRARRQHVYNWTSSFVLLIALGVTVYALLQQAAQIGGLRDRVQKLTQTLKEERKDGPCGEVKSGLSQLTTELNKLVEQARRIEIESAVHGAQHWTACSVPAGQPQKREAAVTLTQSAPKSGERCDYCKVCSR